MVVSIQDPTPRPNGEETILEMFERLRNSVPPDTWDDLPTDLAKNKKHYSTATPKKTTDANSLRDSGHWIALLNPRDQMHEQAKSVLAGMGAVAIVTTQMVLAEALNHLSREGALLRNLAVQMVRGTER